MNFNTLTYEQCGSVGLITLNRQKQLNALNNELMDELSLALNGCELDSNVRCVILTGSDKAFAAGADIEAMREWGFSDVYMTDYITRNWEGLRTFRKPVIAAVSGYALGGGCELAMMCDIIIAGESAIFGQPEVKLGILPGAGGTQRLPRAIGKAKAMDLCLTGKNMTAKEAESAGLISRVVPDLELQKIAMECAEKIASYSLPVLMMIKESINQAYETGLGDGILFERRVFHSAFALNDRKEGMAAFLEKRKPAFQNK